MVNIVAHGDAPAAPLERTDKPLKNPEMKRSLLTCGLILTALLTQAQVTCFVEEPASLSGALDFTWAQGWGSNPDLNNPANAVSGTAVWMQDGSGTWGCNAATNGAEIAGNIAVIRRGGPPGDQPCEFGLKSLNAQNAGAIAVVIVNNAPGAPLAMGGGSFGSDVTIPVVMITDAAGALLEDEIIAGNVVLFIGSLTGQFPYNLGMERRHVLQPPSTARPQLIAQNASELSVQLGAWVINYGSATDTGAKLRCTITSGGSTVYDQESATASIAPGDSAWFSLPTFSQSSYNGHYAITYTAVTSEDDGFPQNNVIGTSLNVGSVFSYAGTDPSSGIPQPTQYVLGADATDMTTCIYFANPNAGRLAATGMYVSGFAGAPEVITDRLVEVTAYLWTEPLQGPNTLPTQSGLAVLESGEYFFDAADQGNTVFVPFANPVPLEGGDKYLFCMETYDNVVRHGWDNQTDYDQHITLYEQPVSMIKVSGSWFNGFSNLGGPPAIGVQMADVNSIGIDELQRVDITPYPNPANDIIRIPLKDMNGAAVLQIFDVTGAKLAEQRVSVGGNDLLLVDVNGMSNGTYVFQMNFEDGRLSTFRVVVSR